TARSTSDHPLRSPHPCTANAPTAKPVTGQPLESRAYYDRKRHEGKHHVAALIALARRRIDVLFAMLRDGTFYQPPTPATA
ncbi:hypothetical protein ACH4C6_36385, partial [Streptomyces sp. NPDC017943]